MDPIKTFSIRSMLGASLPPHYPETPPNFEDVSLNSSVPLPEIYSTLCDEDIALFNQIRRFRGPWLLSHSSDHDHVIVTASNKFVSDMGYSESELIGENCKKLQSSHVDFNKESNAKLSAAFKANTDVHVVLLNFKGDGRPFGNSLSILMLRNKSNEVVYHLGVIKIVAPPLPPSAA
ncbi:hypothetical protein TrRE_jg5665 [Triparma retinervis]|uniref:PAS domain-containing protein n=1 Tax=Triparma retinervis TaxID=2557542 RepID=A0A9W7AML9_9STRA|nr:hypothetical protein TrRE_jg5665 [Triparma retinervis]